MSENEEAGAGGRPLILVVEDDRSYAKRLVRNLDMEGFESVHAESAEAALPVFAENRFNAVLTDLKMPGMSGLELLDELKKNCEATDEACPPVIILTSVGDVQTAVDAMRRGAADFLTKESTREEIAVRLRNNLRQGKLATEVDRLRRSLDRVSDFSEIIGSSESVAEVKTTIAEIAPSNITVLITGETGVGKELIARAIHKASDRSREPFVEVNCAALPEENMFLSELFGHERGAFTGAVSRKLGQFELADRGTLFLDEVGELGPMAQARLLRAVETLSFSRLGGERPIKVNCRLLFATNRDLAKEVEAGNFRQDLLYRINVCPITMPPLRTHPEDIPALARYFAGRMAEKHGLASIEFADDAISMLKSNPWPGNVRELRNVIERLLIRFRGRTVEARHMKELNMGGGGGVDAAGGAIILPDGGIDLDEAERALVMQALQRCDWNQRRAAKLLGISVDRINARVKKFGITHPSWRVHKD